MTVKTLRRQLAAAIAMTLVSTVALGSSTYAWFTMNKEVSATNMKVKAKAEAGLLINEVKDASDANWDDEATANALPGTALIPTSTTNGTSWFHANSKISSDEAGATSNQKDGNLSSAGYEELLTLAEEKTDAVAGTNAENIIAYKNNDGAAGYSATGTDNAYYVMYKYYLRVSNDTGLTLARTANAQNVAIKEVAVTSNPATPVSEDLNKALRVGIKIGGKMYIYAPVYGAGTAGDQYFACTGVTGTGSTQTITNKAVDAFATDQKVYTALASLPGTTNDGTEVDIYLWFEGEDDNCQSDKITPTLDDLTVNVTFSLETIETAPSTISNNEF